MWLLSRLKCDVFKFCVVGGKVTQSTSNGITLINNEGTRLTLKDESESSSLPAPLELLWRHAQDARAHCLLIERTLRQLPGQRNFPVIIGRRPTTATTGKENQTQNVIVLLIKIELLILVNFLLFYFLNRIFVGILMSGFFNLLFYWKYDV